MATKLKRNHKFWKQKFSDIEKGTKRAGKAHSNHYHYYYHYSETQNNWVLMILSY